MSKGLEALIDLSQQHKISLTEEHRIECYKIIEKELKALEIIRETPEFAWYVTIYKNAYEMIADAKGFRINESAEELQEKFDLLKEVLL